MSEGETATKIYKLRLGEVWEPDKGEMCEQCRVEIEDTRSHVLLKCKSQEIGRMRMNSIVELTRKIGKMSEDQMIKFILQCGENVEGKKIIRIFEEWARINNIGTIWR